MAAPPVVDLVAGRVDLRCEPGDAVALSFEVPATYDSGTWTATVYRNAESATGEPLLTITAPSFDSLTSTFTFTSAQIAGLIPSGSVSFHGWWKIARTLAGVPRTWGKGDFIVDPKQRLPHGTGTQAIRFVVINNVIHIDGDLARETAARIAADAVLQAAIDAEAAARASADAGLTVDILDEAAERAAGDDDLQANLDNETGLREAADTTEIAARIAGDTALQADVDQEITDRTAADATEAAARTAADAALQDDIDQEVTNRTAAVAAEAASRAAADTDEAAARAAAVTAEATTRANADTAETSARTAADTALQDAIDQAVTDSTAAVAAEAAARSAADDDLADADTAEAAARVAADITLQAAIGNEAVARATGDADEATARTDADTTLQTAIDAEAAVRAAADTALQGAVDDEATARAAGDSDEAAARDAADTAEAATRAAADTAEAAARAAADTTLQTNLTAEAAARAAADTTEAAARLAGDAAVQAAVDGEIVNRLADVGAEAAARSAADVAATAALAVETADRVAGDAAEAATRTSADAAISASVTALDVATLKKNDNLSDVSSAAVSRTNLALHQVPAPAMRSGRWYRVPAMATLATGVPTLDVVYAMPKYVVSTVLVERLGAEVTSAGSAGAVVRLGIWADDNTGRPGALLLDAGTIDGTSATVQSLTVSQELTRGWYWFGAVAQVATSTLRTTGTPSETVQLDLVGTPTAGEIACAFTATGVTGALGDFTVDDVAAAGIALHVRLGPTGTFGALREDGGFVLREDGFHMLREDG